MLYSSATGPESQTTVSTGQGPLPAILCCNIQLTVREAKTHPGKCIGDKRSLPSPRNSGDQLFGISPYMHQGRRDRSHSTAPLLHRARIFGGLQIPLWRDPGVGHHQLFSSSICSRGWRRSQLSSSSAPALPAAVSGDLSVYCGLSRQYRQQMQIVIAQHQTYAVA